MPLGLEVDPVAVVVLHVTRHTAILCAPSVVETPDLIAEQTRSGCILHLGLLRAYGRSSTWTIDRVRVQTGLIAAVHPGTILALLQGKPDDIVDILFP